MITDYKVTQQDLDALEKEIQAVPDAYKRYTLQKPKDKATVEAEGAKRLEYFDTWVMGENSLLRPSHRLVLAVLFRHAGFQSLYNQDRFITSGQLVRITLDRIVDITGLDKRAVKGAIKRLTEVGHLEIIKKGELHSPAIYGFPALPVKGPDEQKFRITTTEMTDQEMRAYAKGMMPKPFTPPWEEFNEFFDGGLMKEISPSASILYLYLFRHQLKRHKEDKAFWVGRSRICPTVLSKGSEWRALEELKTMELVDKAERRVSITGIPLQVIGIRIVNRELGDGRERVGEAQVGEAQVGEVQEAPPVDQTPPETPAPTLPPELEEEPESTPRYTSREDGPPF